MSDFLITDRRAFFIFSEEDQAYYLHIQHDLDSSAFVREGFAQALISGEEGVDYDVFCHVRKEEGFEQLGGTVFHEAKLPDFSDIKDQFYVFNFFLQENGVTLEWIQPNDQQEGNPIKGKVKHRSITGKPLKKISK
jgi:hypothetical protein